MVQGALKTMSKESTWRARMVAGSPARECESAPFLFAPTSQRARCAANLNHSSGLRGRLLRLNLYRAVQTEPCSIISSGHAWACSGRPPPNGGKCDRQSPAILAR